MKRINKFHIINIKMEGFKKFKEPYSVEFDRFTCISGGNGQGKSTIADAISYAFCGTPFWGEKSCDRLLNSESREMCVEVQFVDENAIEYLPNTLRELGITKVYEAFDMDKRSKPEVKQALITLRNTLSDMGVECVSCSWNPKYKGMDDYILAKTMSMQQVPLAA